MKYTSPIYTNEAIETKDVICESPYSIAHINKEIVDPNTGNVTVEKATQITVDIGKLF